MTEHKPLTTLQLANIEAAIAAYQRHAPTGFACCTAHPVADAGAGLLAEVLRLKGELADYEVLSPQQCPKGVHADWLIDSEYGHACPWCQIDDLKATSVPDETEYAVRMPGSNDVWPRREFLGGHWERVLNEGGQLLERLIRRGPWVEAPNQCPGFEGNPVAPDLCAGCHEPRDTHVADAAAGETVHGLPVEGSGLTPCCGRTPFELPRTDRMTQDDANVTCAAAGESGSTR